MKGKWFLLLFLTIMGCGYEHIEDEQIVGDELVSLGESVSRNALSEDCKVCKMFNKAYGQYASEKAAGFKQFNKKDGCCKNCYEGAIDNYLDSYTTLHSDQIRGNMKVLEASGFPMECPACGPFSWMNSETALNSWLITFRGAINYAVEYGSTKRCTNYVPKDSIVDPEHPIPGGPSIDLGFPDLFEVYTDVLDMRTDRFIEMLGGTIEENWYFLEDQVEINLLKICYSFNQNSEHRISSDRGANNLTGQFDAEGNIYFMGCRQLYEYLKQSYFEPELLTLAELRGKVNYAAVAIGKDVVGSSFDDPIFVDIWNQSGFLSNRAVTSSQFYCWRIY